MKKRKMFSVILVIIMALSFVTTSYAAHDIDTEQLAIESIINDIADHYNLSNAQVAKAQVIELSNNSTPIARNAENINDFAIQIIDFDNDVYRVTTITPYITDSNNNLVNTFAYARSLESKNFPDTFSNSDLYISTVSSYQKNTSDVHPTRILFRPFAVQASWSTSKTSLAVSRMHVIFQGTGTLVKYPDYLTTNDTGSATIQWPYSWTIDLNKSNPTKDQPYNAERVMPSDRAISLNEIVQSGLYTGVEINYTLNGSSKTFEDGYTMYTP